MSLLRETSSDIIQGAQLVQGYITQGELLRGGSINGNDISGDSVYGNTVSAGDTLYTGSNGVNSLVNPLNICTNNHRASVNTGSSVLYLGDTESLSNSTSITLDDAQKRVDINAATTFRAGDIYAAATGASLQINGATGVVRVGATNIELSGATLVTPTAGANTGHYLVLKVNGQDFKISLLDP